MFVTLQVAVICVPGFFILGLRGGGWNARIFLGIPIVLVFFSYLFSVCVLLGIITRSALPSLALTILFWLFCFSLSLTEVWLLEWRTGKQVEVENLRLQIDTYDKRITMMQPRPPATNAATQPTRPEPILLTDFKAARERLINQLPEAHASAENAKWWHEIFYAIKTFLPKTGETTNLLDRFLFTRAEEEAYVTSHDRRRNKNFSANDPEINAPQKREDVEFQNQLRDRSITWIVGTSLLFEAVVLSVAAWIFHRRDF